jgi:isoleucyl-tRNA synthetase
MKLIANAIQGLRANDIKQIEEKGGLDIEINGKSIRLQLDDVEITSQDIEGWLVANQGAITVALDVTISEPLRAEGIARELVNRIQNLRKDSGFEVTDRIEVFLQADKNIENAIKLNLEYIKLETLTDQLHLVEQLDKGIEVSFDAVSSKLYIQKFK